jgi:hypothetical protein
MGIAVGVYYGSHGDHRRKHPHQRTLLAYIEPCFFIAIHWYHLSRTVQQILVTGCDITESLAKECQVIIKAGLKEHRVKGSVRLAREFLELQPRVHIIGDQFTNTPGPDDELEAEFQTLFPRGGLQSPEPQYGMRDEEARWAPEE